MPVRDGDHHRNHHVMAIFSKESQLDLRRQSAIPNSNGGGRSSGDEFQLHFTTSQGGRDLRCVDPEVEAGTFYLNWWLYHVISSHMTHFFKQWCSWSIHEVHIWNPVDHVLRGDKLPVTWVLSAWISRPCPQLQAVNVPHCGTLNFTRVFVSMMLMILH